MSRRKKVAGVVGGLAVAGATAYYGPAGGAVARWLLSLLPAVGGP